MTAELLSMVTLDLSRNIVTSSLFFNKLCSGTVVCDIWFDHWLSLTLTGFEGVAGLSAGFRNSRFRRSTWLSASVFTK